MVRHGIPRRRFVRAVGGGGLALASVGVASAGGVAQRKQPRNFLAYLTGDGQVPPVETGARGLALFKLDPDVGLHFTLYVVNIVDLRMAHVHLGAAGENGPVVAWLYPEDGPPPKQIDGGFGGVPDRGTITTTDLLGPLEGKPLAALVAAIKAGKAYVNVHTAGNPDGEIRGQIG